MFDTSNKDTYRFLCIVQVDAVERYVISLQQPAPDAQWVCRNLTPVRNYMDSTRRLFYPDQIRDVIGCKDEDFDVTWVRFQQVQGKPLCPIEAVTVLPQEFVALPHALTTYFRFPTSTSATLLDLEEIRIIRRIREDSNVYEVRYIAPRCAADYTTDRLTVYKAGLGVRMLNWHQPDTYLFPNEQHT